MDGETAPAAEDLAAITRDALAVALATGLYGTGFGAVSVASGLDVAQTCVLSLAMFTGASQFALVGVLGAGGGAVSAALTATLLGARNALYGLRLAALLDHRGARRLAAAHLVIDESTAMAVTRTTRAGARRGFWVTGLGVFVLWNLATLAGALAGSALGDPRTYGLDAAVGAAFLALLWPRLDAPGTRVAALVAALLATGLVPLTPAGVPVLVAGLVVGLGISIGSALGSTRDREESA